MPLDIICETVTLLFLRGTSTVTTGGTITTKFVTEVVVPAAVCTVMRPVVAPAGLPRRR